MARGGERPGAGRKALDSELKRVQVSISVKPETKRMIQEMRKKHIRIGALLDSWISSYFEKM